jgi:hypothetical protein
MTARGTRSIRQKSNLPVSKRHCEDVIHADNHADMASRDFKEENGKEGFKKNMKLYYGKCPIHQLSHC